MNFKNIDRSRLQIVKNSLAYVFVPLDFELHKVTPVTQGDVVPNERLDHILDFMVEQRKKYKPVNRSTKCPRRKHLVSG